MASRVSIYYLHILRMYKKCLHVVDAFLQSCTPVVAIHRNMADHYGYSLPRWIFRNDSIQYLCARGLKRQSFAAAKLSYGNFVVDAPVACMSLQLPMPLIGQDKDRKSRDRLPLNFSASPSQPQFLLNTTSIQSITRVLSIPFWAFGATRCALLIQIRESCTWPRGSSAVDLPDLLYNVRRHVVEQPL